LGVAVVVFGRVGFAVGRAVLEPSGRCAGCWPVFGVLLRVGDVVLAIGHAIGLVWSRRTSLCDHWFGEVVVSCVCVVCWVVGCFVLVLVLTVGVFIVCLFVIMLLGLWFNIVVLSNSFVIMVG